MRDLLRAGDDGDKEAQQIIQWENRPDGIFRIVDSKRVAELWGARKQNEKMTYEKLSRALRSDTAVTQHKMQRYTSFTP